MRRRWVFMAVVLVVSVAAVCGETVVMAVTLEFELDNVKIRRDVPWPREVPADWSKMASVVSRWPTAAFDRETYLTMIEPEWRSESLFYSTVRITRVGWPLRCAVSETMAVEARNGYSAQPLLPQWQLGVKIPDWARPPASQLWTDRINHIPLRPIWPGFAVNVLLNACVIGPLMLVPGWIVRVRRRAKRACPECGYALAGLEKDARCPECGKR